MLLSRDWSLLGGLGLLAMPALASANTDDPPAPPPATLTGEWGGARTDLRDKGIDLVASVTSEVASNVTGGDRKLTTETGQVAFGANIDADKLFGLKGGSFQVLVSWRQGPNLNNAAGLGSFQQPQEIYGGGQTTRISQFWYGQDLGGGVSIKVGRMPTGEDFGSFACNTMANYFCGATTGNIDGAAWHNWPVSQWGGIAKWNHRDWYLMAGAYEENPRNQENTFTIGYFSGATGALIPIEAGVRSHLGAGRLPGLYRAGGWINTADAPDVLLGIDGRPALATTSMMQDASRHGVYLMAQQQLTGHFTQDPGKDAVTTQGLTAFFTATAVDRGTSTVSDQITAGLRYMGLPGRPRDQIGISYGLDHANPRLAELAWLRAGGTGARLGSEQAWEVDYTVQVTGWFSIEPNVQYFLHPGGDMTRRAATVLGLKTAVTL